MFGRKKTKKESKREQLFKKEVYIPKKRLDKKGRTLPTAIGKKRGKGANKSQKSVGRKIIIFFLWLFFFGEVLYVLLFANFFTIQALEVQREGETAGLADEQIRAYIEESFKGKWLKMIPKDNLFLLRPTTQEKRLEGRFPRLALVEVHRSFPEKLSILITEKPFQMLWCMRDDCFLIDEEGKVRASEVFFRYPEEQGKVVRIQDTAEEPVSIGTQVLQSEDQQFVKDIMTDFTLRTELTIEGSIERPTRYAREMRIRTNKGFTIFFDTRLPVAQSLNSLMLVLQKEIPTNEWDKIDYIDLRTENRIYYTRKDRAPEKTEFQKQREEEEQRKKEDEEKKNQENQTT